MNCKLGRTKYMRISLKADWRVPANSEKIYAVFTSLIIDRLIGCARIS